MLLVGVLFGDWKVLALGVEAAMDAQRERELGFLGEGGGGERERGRERERRWLLVGGGF